MSPVRRTVGWSTCCSARPTTTSYGDEPVYWDGEPVGHVRSGGLRPLARRRRAGSPGIARDDAITAAALAAGSFEIDVAGTRVPAQVSLKPFFDPERSRVLC